MRPAHGSFAHRSCSSRSEAAALLGTEGLTAEQAALALGPLCDMAIVTDGANGSCISALGTLHVRCRATSPCRHSAVLLTRCCPRAAARY